MNKERNIANLPLDGGLLCLDFVNTVQTRKKPVFHDYLSDINAFFNWCLKLNILTTNEADLLKRAAAQQPARSAYAYKVVIAARETLYQLFSAHAAGKPVPVEVLNAFNGLLAEALSHIAFSNEKKGLTEVWEDPDSELTAPLWKVIKSAYQILTAPEAKYVKECSACGWLFLDKSRTHTRRWCNPLECGSIDKATRYYHRQKAKKEKA